MPMPFQKFQKSWKCWTACVLGQMLNKRTDANVMRKCLPYCLLMAAHNRRMSRSPLWLSRDTSRLFSGEVLFLVVS